MSNNVLLTPQAIARQVLLRLASTLNFGGLIYKDFSGEFQQVGDTIQVKKPAVFVANEFNGTVVPQDMKETSVPVKLDIFGDITVKVSSKDLTLSIENFSRQFIDGAVLAIRELVDQKIAAKYIDIPYYTGVSGTTPATLKAGFTEPMKKLNINKVPNTNRAIVFDPVAQAELLNLDTVVAADKSGSTDALRDASIGRIMGFDTFMNQNVKTHVAGGYTALADVTITAGAEGATTISLTSAAGTSTAALKKGDILALDGKQHVITEDTANAVAGVIAAVKIYPALGQIYSAMTSKAVTFPDVTSRGHVANMAFHENAFVLVSRPIDKPMGGVDSYTTTADGISVRVTMGYDMTTKENIVSVDCLFGVATLYPEFATRILG
jgi:hypothetical protein